MGDNIPVYHADGQLWRWVGLVELFVMKNVRVVKNRRGHVTRAYLTGCDVMRPLAHGNAGQTYQEPVDCGKVWSMQMAPGVRL